MHKSLQRIGYEYNTDKAGYHGYLNFYESYFKQYCDDVTNIIEFGVWQGSSAKMWLEYFNHSDTRVYGVDIGECDIVDDRYTFIKGRQEDVQIKNMFRDDYFDIIIDDGGHLMSQQQETLKNFWSKLKCGGLYVIEDLHTSFVIDYIDITPTTYDLLKFGTKSKSAELNDILDNIKDIDFYHRDDSYNFYSSITCIIKK